MKLHRRSRFWIPVVGLVTVVAVACAPPAAPAAPPAPPAAPAAAVPTPAPRPTPVAAPVIVRGGELVLRAHGTFTSIDPLWPGGTTEARVSAPMYSRLVSLDQEEKLQPLVAKEWSVGEGGKVFTFKLRDDVQFHDGKKLTAEDVVYSFNMTIDPPKGVNSRHKGVFGPVIATVEAPDPQTVRITTKKPVGWFLSHVPIVQIAPKHAHEPKAAEGGFAATGLGSGPFKWKAYTPGVELQMERNENYFKKGLPYLDTVRWFVIPDEQAVVAAFVTGRILHSGSRDLTKELTDAIASQTKVNLDRYLRPIFIGYAFNLKHPQLANKRVREALVLAIDERTVSDVAYPGLILPGSWFPGEYGIPAAERNKYAMYGFGLPLDQRLDRAKKILAEEKITDVQLNNIFDSGHRRASDVLQELLGRVGVKVNLVLSDRATYFQRATKEDFDINTAWVGISPFGEPEHFIATVWSKDASPSVTGRPPGYTSPRVEELYAQIQNTLDPNKRIEITRDIDRTLMDEMPSKLFGWLTGVDVVSPRVRGYFAREVFHPARILESVWLAPQ